MPVKSRVSRYDVVKDSLRGRWHVVIHARYPELVPALQRPGFTRITDPVHGSRKGANGDGFRFYRDFLQTGGGISNVGGGFKTGIDLVAWLEGCDAHQALLILENILGIDPNGPPIPRKKLPKRAAPIASDDEDPVKIEKRNQLLAKIWDASEPLQSLPDDHQAIRYFRETRGIDDLDLIRSQSSMRFSPSLYYCNDSGSEKGWFPGVVSMFHDASKASVGLHRIYLDPTEPRKAKVEKAKKALRRLGQILNGAVHIAGRVPPSSHVNLCEGTETGLAIASAIGRPVLATTTAQLLESWTPFENTRRVTIWVDRDAVSPKTGYAAGLHHSRALAKRLSARGIKGRMLVPPAIGDLPSSDWNDVLQHLSEDVIFDTYEGSISSAEVYEF